MSNCIKVPIDINCHLFYTLIYIIRFTLMTYP